MSFLAGNALGMVCAMYAKSCSAFLQGNQNICTRPVSAVERGLLAGCLSLVGHHDCSADVLDAHLILRNSEWRVN